MARTILLTICLMLVTVTGLTAQQVQPQNKSPRSHLASTQKAEGEQQTYRIPFDSRGNVIRLQVVNTSSHPIDKLDLEVKNVPTWMTLTPSIFSLGNVKAGKQKTASFTFHVDKEAPIGTEVNIRFEAKSNEEYDWQKTIALQVEAPTKVKLEQNYPNPFNPSTTINYVLPAQMNVQITVYNILGQKVAMLADEIQQAGSQQVRWDGSGFASGLYFYRIVADAPGSKKIVQSKKMMLIK